MLEVRYRRQYRKCGKKSCRCCAEGVGHGPYWYAFWREDGRLRTRYLGKDPPPGAAMPNGEPALSAVVRPADATGDGQPASAEQFPLPPTALRHAPEIASDIHGAAVWREDTAGTHGLRIWVLGRFRVERAGALITDWRRQTAALVLKLLLLAEGHRLSREHLAYQLAPGAKAETARTTLTAAVHALRRALEPELASAARSRYLQHEGETLSLQLGPDDWVDMLAFEQALDAAHGSAGTLPQLEAAAALYGGDLLPDETAEWCLAPRQALQLRWHGLLLTLAEAQVHSRCYEAAIVTLMRLLKADATQEEAAYRLIALLARQGRRPEALRIYAALKQALRRELHTVPAAETEALAAALRAGEALPRRRAGKSSPQSFRAPAPPRQAGPLVGRVTHLARIRDALLAAREGHGEVLLLAGEGGIGKTRLTEEAARIATMYGFTVLCGRAGEGEHRLPYAPIVEALRMYVEGRPRKALQRDLVGASAVTMLLPELAGGLLGIGPSPPPGDSSTERLRLWMAVRALLATASASRPILLTLEDLHWADEATLGLLAYLARRCRDLRLLFLGTMREDLRESHPLQRLVLEGRREGSLDLLPVRGLQPDEAAALVAQRLGRSLPAEQVAVLHAQCNGNPLFMQELLVLLEGRPERDADATLTAVLAGEGTLPATVRQTLTGRLDRLSIACRSVLRAASVIGTHFRTDLLASVIGQQMDVVEDMLDEAVAAGLLTEDAPARGGCYVLLHALLHRALYDELLPGQRRRLHGRVAAALIERSPDGGDSIAARIAHHAARSQDHDLAAYWLERAGNHALGMYAPAAVLPYYIQAREHVLAGEAAVPLPAQKQIVLARLHERVRELSILEGEATHS